MNTGFSIGAVERDTGLSKDVLRMWERRYGFPVPERDANGDRTYSLEQMERLRLMKRLMDAGHRPGKLMALTGQELGALAARPPAMDVKVAGAAGGDIDAVLALIREHDGAGFMLAMQQLLARQGLQRFVQDTVASLARQVGERWEAGTFEIYEEHLFTELTQRLLRQAIGALSASPGRPRIVLTTVRDEAHSLGMLMAEALLTLDGATCISLGTEMPVLEIGRAADAHGADIVALSFSAAFPQRQIPALLQQLRQFLAPGIALWAGGAGVARCAAVEGVSLMPDLDHALQALEAWRRRAG